MSDVVASASLAGTAGPEFVDGVHDVLADVWSQAPHVGEDDRELFALAVAEVASNVVVHAKGREPIDVSLVASVTPTSIEAVFTDNADPALIDLTDVSMPDAEAESGRGLALALLALDELVHDPSAGNNTWRLVRNLQA